MPPLLSKHPPPHQTRAALTEHAAKRPSPPSQEPPKIPATAKQDGRISHPTTATLFIKRLARVAWRVVWWVGKGGAVMQERDQPFPTDCQLPCENLKLSDPCTSLPSELLEQRGMSDRVKTRWANKWRLDYTTTRMRYQPPPISHIPE